MYFTLIIFISFYFEEVKKKGPKPPKSAHPTKFVLYFPRKLGTDTAFWMANFRALGQWECVKGGHVLTS